jgi:hypothetical protein
LQNSDPWFHFPIFFAVFPWNDPEEGFGKYSEMAAHSKWRIFDSFFCVRKYSYFKEKIVSQEKCLKWWPKTKMASFKPDSSKISTETSSSGFKETTF